VSLTTLGGEGRSHAAVHALQAQQTGIWSVAVVARPLAHTPHPLLRENNHTMALSAKCNSYVQAATRASLTRVHNISNVATMQCVIWTVAHSIVTLDHSVFTMHCIVTLDHLVFTMHSIVTLDHSVFTMHSIVTLDHLVFTMHSIVTRAHCGVHNAFHRHTCPLRCSQCIPSSHLTTAVFTMHSIVTRAHLVFTMHSIVTRAHCGVHNAFHRHT
jgi:hypothetical protein